MYRPSDGSRLNAKRMTKCKFARRRSTVGHVVVEWNIVQAVKVSMAKCKQTDAIVEKGTSEEQFERLIDAVIVNV